MEKKKQQKRGGYRMMSLLLVLVLCMGLLAGCSSSSDEEETAAEETQTLTGETDTEEDSETDAEEDADEESSSGEHVENLVIGTLAENNVFNSQTQTDAFGRMNYNGLTQGNFVYRDENNELQPYFWTSFEISEDGTEIDFTMPLDAVWSDGEPVTMEDMVFTFEYMRDVKQVGSLQNLVEVEVTSEDSGTLIFSEPDAYYWINSSCMNTAHVYAKHIWEGVEDYESMTGDEAAVGCGPYRLVSYDTDSQTSYYEAIEENDYLGEITVDSVTVQSYSDETALVMALISGEIDAMFNYANPIDATLIDTLEGVEDIDLGESEFSGFYQLEYGQYREPGDDQAFRIAVSYALDYEQLAVAINGDYGTIPSKGVISSTCKGYDDSIESLEYDVDKANELLDEAGYLDVDGDGYRELPDGSEMDLSVLPQYSSTSMDMRLRIAEIVMNSLDEVGIKNHLDEENIANDEIWEETVTNGDYDISITFTTSGMSAYSTAFRYFMGELAEGESSWIWGTITDDEFIDTYYAMTKAISDEDYIENCQKLQQYMAENMCAQALCWETAFFPYRTDEYTGWIDYPSWGVINCETWFTLTTK